MNSKWKETEKQYIRENYDKMTDKMIALELTSLAKRKITLYAVRKVRQEMGLAKASGRGVCKKLEK